MDIATGRRDKGAYVIRTVGRQIWAEDHGTWQAHGVRLELMYGTSLLAVCKLEVPGTLDAEDRGAEEAQQIEPWVRTLRYLQTARSLRSRLQYTEALIVQAENDGPHMPMLDHLKDEVLAYAEGDEVKEAESLGGLDPLGVPLTQIVTARLRMQMATALKAAVAFAPDVSVTPIHPAWEQPPMLGLPGISLAQEVARDLLAGWAAVRDLRDPLVTWAVAEAGLTRSEVQATTSLSRSTINRLLP